MCLASKEELATALLETVSSMQIDALGITPSAFSLIAAHEVPSCLKQITTVGEPLSERVANEWAEKVDLRVSYGLRYVFLAFCIPFSPSCTSRRLQCSPTDHISLKIFA